MTRYSNEYFYDSDRGDRRWLDKSFNIIIIFFFAIENNIKDFDCKDRIPRRQIAILVRAVTFPMIPSRRMAIRLLVLSINNAVG